MSLPDSGARSEFSTGAVRDASVGKGLPSRIPPEALRRLARRFEDGENKYPDHDGVPNWMRGIPLSRCFDSAFRHLLAAAEGDTSEDHLGAVLWNISAWVHIADEIAAGRLPAELDDLPFRVRDSKSDLQVEVAPTLDPTYPNRGWFVCGSKKFHTGDRVCVQLVAEVPSVYEGRLAAVSTVRGTTIFTLEYSDVFGVGATRTFDLDEVYSIWSV